MAVFLLTAPDARARQHDHHAPRIEAQAAPETHLLGPSLDDVLHRLRAASPHLEQARLGARAAGLAPEQADRLPDPMISTMLMGGAGRMARSEWMAEQAFPWPGVLGTRRNLAEREAERSALASDLLGGELELRATETYLRIAAIDHKRDHLDHFVEELRGFEAAAVARYEVGEGPQQAILRLQLEKNALEERDVMLSRERATLVQTLRRLVGDLPEPGWLDGRLALPDPATLVDPAQAPLTADEAEAQSSIEAADAQVRLAELAFRPMVTARLSYVEGSVMRRGRDAVGIGAALSLPLSRGKLRAGLEAARLERERALAGLETVRLALDTERAAATDRIEHGRALLALVDGTLIPQAEATQQATVAAYINGRADYLDLVDAERTLLDLRLSRVDRHLEVALDHAALVRLHLRPESEAR